MAKPVIVQTVDVLRLVDTFGGAVGSIEVRVDGDRVVMLLNRAGQHQRRYSFTAEQAKRIGDGLMTAAVRLSIPIV